MQTSPNQASKFSIWPKANAGAGNIANWFTVYTITSAALSAVAKRMTRFELNWAEAIFVGLGAAAILALVLSASLIAIRIFRPLPAPTADQTLDALPSDEDEYLHPGYGELNSEIESLRDAVARLEKKEEQRAASYGAILMDIAEAREGAIDYSKGIFDTLKESIAENTKAASENNKFARKQIISLYDGLNAIYQRERLHQLAEEIHERSLSLRSPTTGKTILDHEEWERWEEKQRKWRDKLEEWCAVANCYKPDIKQQVLVVTEDELQTTGQADVSQFPSAEAYNMYKAFNIRYFKWKEYRSEADEAVLQQARFGSTDSRHIEWQGA